MNRRSNTDSRGNQWTENMKRVIWGKGTPIPNYSSEHWRVDICGNIMQYSEHGNRDSKFGWEIDHILPVSHGGTDDLDNLQPLHWVNNSAKGNQLDWSCGGIGFQR